MAATGVLVSVPAFFYEALPYINWDTVGTSAGLAVTMVVCGLLLIGIPVVGLIHLILHLARKERAYVHFDEGRYDIVMDSSGFGKYSVGFAGTVRYSPFTFSN